MNSPKKLLAVCLNPAWQKTLKFSTLRTGTVNRAVEALEGGGGKGVNVARVLRMLDRPVAVAAVVGGATGTNLKAEFARTGVEDMTVTGRNATRCCYTVIDLDRGEATELIDPSMVILPEETDALLERLRNDMHRFSTVALSGSIASGIPEDIYGQISRIAGQHGLPVVLDAVKPIQAALEAGVTLLKINAGELAQLSGGATLQEQAAGLLKQYPRVQWAAITDGPAPACIVHGTSAWSVTLPRLDAIVSPIGAGDCATAMMCSHLLDHSPDDEEGMVQAFGLACACASASCLTDSPSVFQMTVAEQIHPEIRRLPWT